MQLQTILRRLMVLGLAGLVACSSVSQASPYPPNSSNTSLGALTKIVDPISVAQTPKPKPSATLALTPTPDPILKFTQLVQLGRGTVAQIAISPNGRWLIALGNQGLRLYDARTLGFVRSLTSDGKPATEVSWAPDNQRVAVTSDDRAIQLWDLETGEQITVIVVKDGLTLSALAWSPVAEQVAVLGNKDDQRILQIWELPTGNVLNEFVVTQADDIVWSPDGKRLAFYRFDFISWLDLSQPAPQVTLVTTLGVGPVHSVAWSPDGTQLVAGSGEPNPFGPTDYTVRVWDITADKPRGTLRYEWAVPLPATSVAWSPNGERIAAGTENRTIHVWDAHTGEGQATLEGHGAGVISIAWLSDNQHMVSAGRDGTIRQWDVERGTQIRSASDERSNPPLALDVAWSPNGDQIALAGQDGTIQLWNTTTGKQVVVLVGHRGAVNGVAWSPNSRLLASGGDDGYLRIWDIPSQQMFLQLPQQGEPKSRITSVAWQANNEQYIAAGGYPLQVWNTNTGELAWEGNRDTSVLDTDWSSKSHLAFARDAASVMIVDASTGRKISESSLARTVNSIAWSPNESQLLLGTGFGETSIVRVLDVASKLETKIELELQEVMSVAWSPNAHWCAVGDKTGAIQLLDAMTLKPILKLGGHMADINSLDWSPDGRYLVSSSQDGTVRIWGAP